MEPTAAPAIGALKMRSPITDPQPIPAPTPELMFTDGCAGPSMYLCDMSVPSGFQINVVTERNCPK